MTLLPKPNVRGYVHARFAAHERYQKGLTTLSGLWWSQCNVVLRADETTDDVVQVSCARCLEILAKVTLSVLSVKPVEL